jgi:hypothetical protein
MWRGYCLKHGYPVAFDPDGVTDFGAATLGCIDLLSLPASLPWADLASHAKSSASLSHWKQVAWKMRNSCYVRCCSRIRGRLYHPLVNMPRALRRRLRIRWLAEDEPVATVDMSGTYWALLTKYIRDPVERAEVREILSSGDIYQELAIAADMAGVTRDYVKAEVQKQCLFWVRFNTAWSARPLWRAMKARFPSLWQAVFDLRKQYSGSQLSDLLTHAEADFFVDRVLPDVASEGVPCLTIHDCLLVPASAAEFVKLRMEEAAEEVLGWVPKFKIDSACPAAS